VELTHAELKYTEATGDMTPSGTTKLIRYRAGASGTAPADVIWAVSPSITTSRGPMVS
jgi:hypothetical protein